MHNLYESEIHLFAKQAPTVQPHILAQKVKVKAVEGEIKSCHREVTQAIFQSNSSPQTHPFHAKQFKINTNLETLSQE